MEVGPSNVEVLGCLEIPAHHPAYGPLLEAGEGLGCDRKTEPGAKLNYRPSRYAVIWDPGQRNPELTQPSLLLPA